MPTHFNLRVVFSLFLALALSVIFLTGLNVLSSPAYASAPACGTSTQVGFTGGENETPPAGGFDGLQASLNHYDPALCTSSGDKQLSTVWVMETVNCQSCEEWAQDGFLKFIPDGTAHNYFFGQCDDCDYTNNVPIPANLILLGPGITDVSDTSYTDEATVVKIADSNQTQLLISPINDPFNNTWYQNLIVEFTPNNIQTFGEVHNEESQTYGDSNDVEQINQLQYQSGEDWYNINLTSGYWSFYEATYGLYVPWTNQELYIWDYRYDSEP